MKERPILFSAPMVRAILDGNKTQTRRMVKTELTLGRESFLAPRAGRKHAPTLLLTDAADLPVNFCPYGQPGEKLWVREAWNPDPPCDGTWGYTAWSGCRKGQISGVPERFRHTQHCIYAATWGHGPLRWTPSIHMPRWASRITLEVTGVRVERLQEISEVDAMAEGITRLTEPLPPRRWSGPNRFTLKGMGSGACAGSVSLNAPAAEDLYRRLWESINGPGSWDLNPWVWVVEFKRLPEDHK